ncbi:MAG: hypothetical protein ACR2M6_04440 [Vampirovibrionia bacterium]
MTDYFYDALAYDYSEALELTESESKSPMAYGKQMKRKILQLGKRYYWKEILENDELMVFWRTTFDVPEYYNSLLVNVYEPGQSISPHTDRTKGLVSGSKVISISISPEGNKEKLGSMKFTDGNRYDLYHNTKIEFDPHEHSQNGIKHSATSIRKRINFTFRHME